MPFCCFIFTLKYFNKKKNQKSFNLIILAILFNFFAVTTVLLDTEKACEFCDAKCNSLTDGVYMCSSCRHFAYKSLVKHHMFVCKQVNKEKKGHCNVDVPVDLQAQGPFCRFCHFRMIVNRLPNLNRLQKYLVQFINYRLFFVNSGRY